MPKVLKILTMDAKRKTLTKEQTPSLARGFDRYFSRIYAYALYRLQDPEVADEITSQTFTAAMSSIDHYKPERGSIDAWLFGIARNVIRKHLRDRRIHKWIPLDSSWSHPTTSMGWVEEIAINNDLLGKLLPLIRILPERERDILSLKFGAEMTNRSIAEITGLTESNVGVILYRTLRRLRNQLQEEDDDEQF